MEDISKKLPRALIICNDPYTGPVWTSALTQKRIHTILELSFANAFKRFDEIIPDLVIIDVTGSIPSALDLLKQLRNEAINPILLLCDGWKEEDLLNAYMAGVDECILKPVSPTLFLAKAQAWLRRSWTIPTEFLEPVQTGGLSLVLSERQLILKDGSIVNLTNLELRLLHLLMCRPNRTVSSAELITRMWREHGKGKISTLKNVVYRLRKKIEVNPVDSPLIRNVAGAGYIFRIE